MTVPIIGDSKPVYYREIAANMYHPWPYLFGLSVAEVPWLIAVTFMHGVIFYPIANLDGSSDTIVQVIQPRGCKIIMPSHDLDFGIFTTRFLYIFTHT